MRILGLSGSLRNAAFNSALLRAAAGLMPAGATLEIGTIEGMAQGEELHPLQEKFLELAALQCGICTPGIVVAAKALLDRIPDPSESEVRFWLAGNLCRCTGYEKILDAVRLAARRQATR